MQIGTALGVAIVSTFAVSRSQGYLAANPGANPLAVLTEGYRHFNHYIPSPKSRIRAFEDLGACVAEMLSEAPPARMAA